MSNFWVIQERQHAYLKVVKWAQRNNIKVETLTKDQIISVLKVKEN